MYRKNLFRDGGSSGDVLNKTGLFENERLLVETYHFKPGQEFSLHCHPSGVQVIFIFRGEGEFVIQKTNEEKQKLFVGEGDVIFLEEGIWHEVINSGNIDLVISQVTEAKAGMETG